jgi:hypothetical protein
MESIDYFFNFTTDELEAIRSCYKNRHRLAVAIQLGFFKMAGRYR